MAGGVKCGFAVVVRRVRVYSVYVCCVLIVHNAYPNNVESTKETVLPWSGRPDYHPGGRESGLSGDANTSVFCAE